MFVGESRFYFALFYARYVLYPAFVRFGSSVFPQLHIYYFNGKIFPYYEHPLPNMGNVIFCTAKPVDLYVE